MVEKDVALKTQFPSFEARPYGGRLVLTNVKTLIVINPGMDTAAGIDSSKLKNGLRGHDGEASESVAFLRYADDGEDDGRYPLVYTYEDPKHEVVRETYKVGSCFLSVDDNGETGFWHVLKNRSDRPILLMISVRKKDVELRKD